MGADGEQIGIVTSQDALERAVAADLDLVEVAPQANPPVCRIMDYGKYKYERGMREKEARKKQARIEVKEIKFRPKIDRHDYETKKGHVVRFLNAGARVKVTIMFRGREMAHTELGQRILDRLVEDLDGLATVEQSSKLDGRNMVMVVAPTKKPAPRVRPTRPPRPEEPEEPGEPEKAAVEGPEEVTVDEGVSES
ncbi:MAG: translation initiation factor IF-3 [Actinomycetota bacterium]